MAAGAEIWDLPPYSPDLNPIEKMWSKVKGCLRTGKARHADALHEAIGKAMARVADQDIVNWFASCDYSSIQTALTRKTVRIQVSVVQFEAKPDRLAGEFADIGSVLPGHHAVDRVAEDLVAVVQ